MRARIGLFALNMFLWTISAALADFGQQFFAFNDPDQRVCFRYDPSSGMVGVFEHPGGAFLATVGLKEGLVDWQVKVTQIAPGHYSFTETSQSYQADWIDRRTFTGGPVRASSRPAARPPDASARIPAGDDSVFEFSNGVKVEYLENGSGGANLRIGNKRPVAITRQALEYRPVPVGTPHGLGKEPTRADAGLVELVTRKQVLIVTRSGKVVNLPLDAERLAQKNESLSTSSELFKYKGREFMAISVEYPDENAKTPVNRGTGETYVIRDDGVSVRVGYGAPSIVESSITIKDGILRIERVRRSIDLDRFTGEARGQTQPPTGTTDDAAEKAAAEFPDLAEEIRSGRTRAFPGDAADEELIKTMRISLGEPETGSAVILGDAGSGKTEVAKRFFQNVIEGKYPEMPRTIRVVVLSRSDLEAGTKFRGQFEEKVKLLKQYARENPLVIFMDEVHAFVGSGTAEDSPVDFFEMIKTELADGTIRIVGTSTYEEFIDAFGARQALMRRLSQITKGEVTRERVIQALDGWADRFNKPRMGLAEKNLVIDLSGEYAATGSTLSKATKLAAHAYSLQTVNGREGAKLSAKTIREAARSLYQLPEWVLDPVQSQVRFESLQLSLDGNVAGMKPGKAALIRLEGQLRARTQDPRKPAIRVLVYGPPGGGKTLLLEQFSLHARGKPATVIEMTKYSQGGVEAFRSELANAVRKDAFAVIVLDEIEKAHATVQLAALNALADGSLTVPEYASSGDRKPTMVKVSLKNATIGATTNAGQRYVLRKRMSNPQALPGTPNPNKLAGIGYLTPDPGSKNADPSAPKPRRPIGYQGVTSGSQEPKTPGVVGFGAQSPSTAARELQAAEAAARAEMQELAAVRQALMDDGLSDALLDRFANGGAIVEAAPPTPAEFEEVVEIHIRMALEEIGRRAGVPIVLENPDDLIGFTTRALYDNLMSNRVAQNVVEKYIRQPATEMLRKLTGEKKKRLGISLRFKAGQTEVETFDPCLRAISSL